MSCSTNTRRAPGGKAAIADSRSIPIPAGADRAIEGAAGDSPDDYRCWQNEDFFNYQPFNLLMTPQERNSLFSFMN